MEDLDFALRTELSRSDRPLTADEVAQLLEQPRPDAGEVARRLGDLAQRGEVHAWGGGRYASVPPERGLEGIVRRLVTDEPMTRTQINVGLPASYRVEPEVLRRALLAMIERGALFASDPERLATGSDRGIRFSVEDPHVLLQSDLLGLLGDQPATVSELARRLSGKPTQRAVEKALRSLEKEKTAHRWRRGSFAGRPVASAIEVELDRALESKPLPFKKLKASLPSGRLVDEGSLKTALTALVQARKVYRMRVQSSVVFGTRAQALALALKDIERRYGLTKDDLRSELTDRTNRESRDPPKLLDDIRQASALSGSSVLPVRDLRSASGLEPGAFDRELLSLMEQGWIDLYEHDRPLALVPEELVVDDRGRSFNAVVLKEVQ